MCQVESAFTWWWAYLFLNWILNRKGDLWIQWGQVLSFILFFLLPMKCKDFLEYFIFYLKSDTTEVFDKIFDTV